MSNQFTLCRSSLFGRAALLIVFIPQVQASSVPREATIIGGNDGGRCVVEADVDGAAEVEIQGATGLLRTLSGRDATWRRFQCSHPLPRNPADFRFARVNGRGSIRLIGDPRGNGGKAVIQIDDPQSGRAGYTFSLQWRRTPEWNGGNWPSGPAPLPPERGTGPIGLPTGRAVQSCHDSVSGRLNRSGYQYVTFTRTIPENTPGWPESVTGTVSGRRGRNTQWFTFSCSVDFRSGTVRSVDLRPRQ